MWPNPLFVKIIARLLPWNKLWKIWAATVIIKKLIRVYNHLIGGNLVTLLCIQNNINKVHTHLSDNYLTTYVLYSY
jgi:hypothetical protein